MTQPPTDSEILEHAIAIAREASTLLRDGWRKGVSVRTKARSDLVTEIDLASERLVRERIGARFPEHLIVGEEEGAPITALEGSLGAHEAARAEGEGRAREGDSGSRPVWYVDPLDGTTNYAHGHPFFCVSIACTRAGEPIAGVVIAPALGIEWAASKGAGLRRNGERCSVSRCDSLEDALMATGFPAGRASRPDNNYRAFLALDAASHGVRRCGAAAIEIAMVADGSYDAFWDIGLRAWDVAAGMLFVREAGGAVTDLDGSPVRLDAGRFMASNGRIHAALARGIAGAIPLPPLEGPPPNGLPAATPMR